MNKIVVVLATLQGGFTPETIKALAKSMNYEPTYTSVGGEKSLITEARIDEQGQLLAVIEVSDDVLSRIKETLRSNEWLTSQLGKCPKPEHN